MCVFLCLYVEPVSRSKDNARSWIKIGSVLYLCTPVSASVPEMTGIYATGGHPFLRMYLWWSLCSLYLHSCEVLCFYDPTLPWPCVSRVLPSPDFMSPDPMFQGSYIPLTLCPLCFNGPTFHWPYVPWPYVSRVLHSLDLMSPDLMFQGSYFPLTLCPLTFCF